MLQVSPPSPLVAEFERRDSDAKHQLNELTRGISFYQRLGLDFEKINDDKLRLVFTQIDAMDPERQFAFNVRITETDVYEVDGCDPAVPGLAAIVKELNERNDFSRFVQLMRQRFRSGLGQ